MTKHLSTLFKGSLFVFAGLLISQILAYITKLYLVKQLTPADYGLFSAVFTLIFLTLFFRDLGLDTAFTKFISEYRTKKEFNKLKTTIFSVLAFQILTSLILVLLFWTFADYLALNYLGDERASLMIKLFSLYIPFGIVVKFIPSYFKGFQRNILFSLFEPLKNAIVLILTFIFFALGYTLLSPILAYVILNIFLILLFIAPIFSTFKFSKYEIKQPKQSFVKLFKFGAPLIGVRFFGKFITYFDILLLTFFSTLENVGIYNIILPTSLLLMIFPNSIGSILMPQIVELKVKKKKKEIGELLEKIYLYLGVLIFPVILGLSYFSSELITTLFKPEYLTGTLAFIILLVAMGFSAFNSINLQYFVGIDKPQFNLKLTIIAAVLNIILNLILIPKYELTGAAIATALSYAITLIFSLNLLKKNSTLTFSVRKTLKLFIANTLFLYTLHQFSTSVFKVTSLLEILLVLVLAGIFYLLYILIFRIISVREVVEIFFKNKA